MAQVLGECVKGNGVKSVLLIPLKKLLTVF